MLTMVQESLVSTSRLVGPYRSFARAAALCQGQSRASWRGRGDVAGRVTSTCTTLQGSSYRSFTRPAGPASGPDPRAMPPRGATRFPRAARRRAQRVTMTGVPRSTRSNRSTISALLILMQP
jgi:hypothetical protein